MSSITLEDYNKLRKQLKKVRQQAKTLQEQNELLLQQQQEQDDNEQINQSDSEGEQDNNINQQQPQPVITTASSVNYPFPKYVSEDGKTTQSAKIYISLVNNYFEISNNAGRNFSDYDKLQLMVVHNTYGAVGNYLYNVQEEAKRNRDGFSWNLFTNNFIKEFTNADEQNQAKVELNRMHVSRTESSLREAMNKFHTKIHELRARLSGVPEYTYKFLYVSKLPPYLNSSLTAHLQQSNKTEENLTLNELFTDVSILIPAHENTYRSERGKFNKRAYGGASMYSGSRKPRDGSSNSSSRIAAVESSSSNGGNNNQAAGGNNETGVNGMYMGNKRSRPDPIWQKVKQYCMENGLCWKCKNKLTKGENGRIIPHDKTKCKHASLSDDVMQSFRQGQ